MSKMTDRASLHNFIEDAAPEAHAELLVTAAFSVTKEVVWGWEVDYPSFPVMMIYMDNVSDAMDKAYLPFSIHRSTMPSAHGQVIPNAMAQESDSIIHEELCVLQRNGR